MSQRPTHIDLDPKSLKSNRNGTPPRELPSPRSGDVPPALSPLDAFAFQGRMLARRFEENQGDGRRISRLPTQAVANEFGRHRQNYFINATSNEYGVADEGGLASSATDMPRSNPEMMKPDFRPKSIHPFVQTSDDTVPTISKESAPSHVNTLSPPLEQDEDDQGPQPNQVDTQRLDGAKEYFTFTSASPQGSRPESLTDISNGNKDNASSAPSRAPHSSLSIATNLQTGVVVAKTNTSESLRSNSSSNLAPPRSPAFPKSPRYQPSIRSVRNDSGDDSDSISHLGESLDTRHLDRRPSFTTVNSSRPRSPFSPLFAPPRPPSANSDYSALASPYPRQSVNFSRPISRAGRQSTESRPSMENSLRHLPLESPQLRPSMDVLSIQESIDTPPLRSAPFASDPNQISTDEERGNATDDGQYPAPSYIYAKYSLPRGRILSRSSMMVLEQAKTRHVFQWEKSAVEANVTSTDSFGDSEIMRPSSSQGTSRPGGTRIIEADLPIHSRSRSADASKSEIILRTHSSKPPLSSDNLTQRGVATYATGTTSSEETVISSTGPKRDQMTPEQHLSQGIISHEEGALQKSTYHLRIAARAGLPTAMLLYALACRHGWGIRPNQAEGVAWLRKAVDSAGLEVAGDDSLVGKDSKGISKEARDYLSERQHKAQLALSIYELGVSYLNGWGVAQDKQFAVRCFEIAGSWGDADALAEAGFCYAKGVGCKKDLRKAADFYRRAEAKGIAMTGNSWIYKDKYMTSIDSTDDRNSRPATKGKDKKPRDKSRTRTIFGGRKRGANQATE